MAGAHASHVAALANAIKANGVVVRLDPPEWLKVLKRTESPLIVIGNVTEPPGATWRSWFLFPTVISTPAGCVMLTARFSCLPETLIAVRLVDLRRTLVLLSDWIRKR